MFLQFGAGNFLRAFADLFIDQLNRSPATSVGPVVVVQSTGKERVEALNRAGGRYHVAIQGYQAGRVVNDTETIGSLAEALSAATQWDRVLALAGDPALQGILSNTTEAGLALDPADASPSGVPQSFPAKLLAVLLARHRVGLAGVRVIPCELVESNGRCLRDLVLSQADRWRVPAHIQSWLRDDCRWITTLVDRIVPGPPREHPLLGVDPLLLSAEPFAFWGVETTGDAGFPLWQHPAVVRAPDISPFTLRKVRILNGAHSALVCKARDFGVETVRECLDHPDIGRWLEDLLFGEIVPVLEGRCDDPAGFARTTLDRFRNPFLEHRLSSIALNHEAKLAVRLRPTLEEYQRRFGNWPPLLSEILR
ncbi:MAG TPA: hypothetical protein P5016_07960 [Verrucomicrobiales bacterium]|nr:hypothetical protein [Verrucomicrobiales bacterium]